MTHTPQQLQERLIDFGAAVCSEVRRLPKDLTGNHIAKQLVRCGTAPAAHYAEARGAESRRDFVHRLQLGLKELRETDVWLRLAQKISRRDQPPPALTRECSELTAILVTSIETARSSVRRPKP